MAIHKNRVHIQFINKDHVVLTTPFFQKTFRITSQCDIDLATMKMQDYDDESDFFVSFVYDLELETFSAEVYALVDNRSKESIGTASYKDNNKVFSVTWDK